jgi:hypothetical protein
MPLHCSIVEGYTDVQNDKRDDESPGRGTGQV